MSYLINEICHVNYTTSQSVKKLHVYNIIVIPFITISLALLYQFIMSVAWFIHGLYIIIVRMLEK